MSSVTTSPNMNLSVPIVSVTPGPEWAGDYNACLSIIDQHTHAPGSGVPITQAAISLSSTTASLDSLSFSGTNAYALRSVKFTAQAAALALATDLGCLYEAGVDLYFNDGSGNQIRLTQGGSIVGTAGSITGLPSGTASASYSAGTFIWQSATATAANMDGGSYIFRNATASSKGLTLSPPNAMASNYALVLPALPSVTSIMALDTSGNITAPYTVDNSTIVIASNVIKVPSQGITSTQIANLTITASQIANTTITAGKIANSTITGTQIASSVALAGSPTAAVAFTAGTSITAGTGLVSGTTVTVGNGPVLSYISANTLDIDVASLRLGGANNSHAKLAANSASALSIQNPGTGSSLPIAVSGGTSSNQTIWGRLVTNVGSATGGEGFTVTSHGSGFVGITFTQPFSAAGAITCTFESGTNTFPISPISFVLYNNVAAGVTIYTTDVSGALTSPIGFSFIAVGTRT